MKIEVKGAQGTVFFFGNENGKVSLGDLGTISMPNDSIFHLLRHFNQVPEEWSQRMIGVGITTKEKIAACLRESGSKWNPRAGLSTPEEVIIFCREILKKDLVNGRVLSWIQRGDNSFCYASHVVSVKEKSEFFVSESPMGKKGLVSLDDVSVGVIISRRFNRGGYINVVQMAMPDTNQVTITLAKRPNGVVQVFSAFPGELTPPIPKEGQEEEEFVYNQKFWNAHALIEN